MSNDLKVGNKEDHIKEVKEREKKDSEVDV